jgi:hypothetical protein
MTLREIVYSVDDGCCVNCGEHQMRHASPWDWQAHHVLKQQWLKRRHAPDEFLSGPKVTILLCKRCHERHESRTATIPLEKLPARVVDGASELGPWAEDLLRRYHPSEERAA